MTMLNSRTCLLLAAVLVVSGCGKQERNEAVQFAKALSAKKDVFASANKTEGDFVQSAKAWCAGIVDNGAGKGAELDQNAAVATELAKNAVAVSAQLSQVRQTIDAVTLKEEYTRSVRNGLTTALTKRQRMLQDVRTMLEQSAPKFLEYKKNKAYAGDTYPAGIGQLQILLRGYNASEDVVADALASLQKNYDLTASEL